MQIRRTETLAIRSESQVVEVRQAVRALTLSLKFSLTDQTKLVTAASEIARNTLTYGKGGDVVIEHLEDGGRAGIRLTFTDQGPGIPDIQRALSDGYTSGSGLGLGLGGSRRLVHEFEVICPPEGGTIVSLLRWK
ncbi:MAG: anti-sigma regulatory factor [Bdellovibrionota bacterium]|nr:MAG: anti-sigma regulatory factor [Pseudomonadota bacterium]